MTITLVNRFETEKLQLNGVKAYCIAPKFKEIRVSFNDGDSKVFSAITYQVED